MVKSCPKSIAVSFQKRWECGKEKFQAIYFLRRILYVIEMDYHFRCMAHEV